MSTGGWGEATVGTGAQGTGRGGEQPRGARRTSKEFDFTQSAMEAFRKIHGGAVQTNGHLAEVWSGHGSFQLLSGERTGGVGKPIDLLLPSSVFLIERPSN